MFAGVDPDELYRCAFEGRRIIFEENATEEERAIFFGNTL